VFAWLQPNGDWGESNAALVVGDQEAVLIDTLFSPALTRRMLETIGARVPQPVRTLINTHSDGDHAWGNQLLAGAEIIATAAAAKIIRAEPPSATHRLKTLAPLLKPLPRIGTLAAYVSWMVGPYDFGDVVLTPPTREFSGALTVSAGSREIHLTEVGPAHTAGDLIVYVPDAGVVVAADVMFVSVHPVMWAGPTANWIAALERIIELKPAVVVPGHGPLAGVAEVQQLRDYLNWLQDAALQRLNAGDSPQGIALELASDANFKRAPWGSWIGPERMVITIATIDRHRRGDRSAIGSHERARLFAGVAAVAKQLGWRPA